MVNLQSSIDELQKEYNRNYEKIEDLEQSYKNISKQFKRKERFEAKIRNVIEARKLRVRNQMIRSCIESLEKEQKQIQTLSDKYLILPKTENTTKEELSQTYQHTQEQLVDEYKQLDMLILKEKNIDLKNRELEFISCLILGLGYLMPAFIVDTLLVKIIGLLFALPPSIVGGIYFINSTKKYKKLIEKLNHELHENPEYVKAIEGKTLDELTEQITHTYLELQQQKTLLEIINNKVESNTQVQEGKQVMVSQLPEMDYDFTKQYK